MLINGWDIAEAGARQWRVSFASCDINSNSDWIEGSPIATLFRNNTSFKTLTIVLMLNGQNREEILLQRSNILAQLLEPSIIELDNYSHKFIGIMSKISAPNEESLNRFHVLQFEFDCSEYGDCETAVMDSVSQIHVNNPGNIMTPLIVEIEPYEDIEDYILRGICRKLSVMGHGIEYERNIGVNHPILASDESIILGNDHVWHDDESWYLDTAGGERIEALVDGSGHRLLVRRKAHWSDDMTPILYANTDWRNDYPVEILNLKLGDKITLDGETGLFTDADGNVPENLIIWELPTLMPGDNLIYQNDVNVKVSLRWYPRYM